MISNHNNFICPECGSHKTKGSFYYKSKPGDNLYSSVLQEIQCGSCYIDIPGHLGMRLSNISKIDAKIQWDNKYKLAVFVNCIILKLKKN